MNDQIIKSLLKSQKLDAVLITSFYNRRWYTTFPSSAGILVIEPNESTIFLSWLYITDGKQKVQNASVKLLEKDSFLKWVSIKNFKRVGIESDYTTLKELRNFRKIMPKVKFVEINGAYLRCVKSPDEITNIKKACEISLLALKKVVPLIKEGNTEKQIRKVLENKMQELGAAKPSFDTIVVSGARAAMPHGKPSHQVLKKGDLVVVDFGAYYKGLCADITRTFVVGKLLDPEKRRVLQTVKEAQLLGIQAVKPGVIASEIDSICRKHIEKKGYGKFFIHSTGHGLGYEIHEEPYVSPVSSTVLKTGHVITVEPGIYIPGFLGVRIEDDVLVTQDGYKVLSCLPKNKIN